MHQQISAKPRLPLLALFITLTTLAVSSSACLTTRAQMREGHPMDGDSAQPAASSPTAPPAPAQVQEVKTTSAYVVDELKAEITQLTGRIEDVERSQKQGLSNANNPTPEAVKKLETRIIELEQTQVSLLETLKKVQAASIPAANPAELLSKARTQAEAGNYEGAIETLSSTLTSAKGKTAEEATFLKAESHFAIKDFKKAIVEYSKFPERFTKSHYMPKALFQIGKSFESLGMKEDARTFYQELVEKFPRSTEAKKARNKVK